MFDALDALRLPSCEMRKPQAIYLNELIIAHPGKPQKVINGDDDWTTFSLEPQLSGDIGDEAFTEMVHVVHDCSSLPPPPSFHPPGIPGSSMFRKSWTGTVDACQNGSQNLEFKIRNDTDEFAN